MRPVFLLMIAIVLLPVHAGSLATPEASPVAGACPVTQPNTVEPPATANVFGRDAGNFGNDYLWTSLWMWGEGVVDVPVTHVNPDGSLGYMKWAWFRFVDAELTIEGRRIDGEAGPLIANVPEGYGAFVATGLLFPTSGCWEVTGSVGDGSLTFVLWVIAPTMVSPDGSHAA